ncbi:MAG: GntR family transcriptional regulator [Marmoricola sp.]|jgi:GntR family transcriptional regulator|nr:GntR family transcriptional regulator [Marmoricola sp.]MCW2838506.1 GntR family transcriptional regulator [Marmoricola sp.]
MKRSRAMYSGDASDPLHQQVRDTIAEAVASGAYAPGEKLPSERRLCEDLGVSRMTLRRALMSLVDDELLQSAAGRGWFVAGGPVGEPGNVLLSFTDLGRERGFFAGAKVLHREVRRADLDEAEALGVAPGSEMLDLRRLRLLDDVAIAIDHSRVPLILAPQLAHVDFTDSSLYAVLREADAEPVRCTASVQAVAADDEQAALLCVEPGWPLLQFSQVALDRGGRPVDLSVVHYRGDRYRFRTSLVARRTSRSMKGSNGGTALS